MTDITITQIINYIATTVLILSFLYVIKHYFFYTPINLNLDRKIFESKFSNFLYKISLKPPFNFLTKDCELKNEDTTDKVDKLNELIIESESSNIHNARTLMTLQYMLIFIAFIIFAFNVLIIINTEYILTTLMNIDLSEPIKQASVGEAITQSLMLLMLLLITPLIPTLKMKKKINKMKLEKAKDLPLLQMFIILFLRSNKTVEEMIFSMSKLNTAYKVTFEQAYRIVIRDKKDALEFLKKSFNNETFEESLDVIKELQDYARDDCLKIMESNLNMLTSELESNKRKSDLSSLVYSQAVVGFPFAAVILLAASPIVQSTFDVLNDIGGGF